MRNGNISSDRKGIPVQRIKWTVLSSGYRSMIFSKNGRKFTSPNSLFKAALLYNEKR